MIDQLGLTSPAPLSVTTLLVNLLLGAIVSFVLAWHFRRFGETFSNRDELARIFPWVTLVTLLIISVVKSSLALSLGLVGALSIVRFRTAIKEPEELAYLFMALAIGLGFGADQRAPTLVAAFVIMGIYFVRSYIVRRKKEQKHNLYLSIEVFHPKDDTGVFQRINEILSKYVLMVDMRRLDTRNGTFQVTYYIDCKDGKSLSALMDGLNQSLPDAALTFVEQKGIPGP